MAHIIEPLHSATMPFTLFETTVCMTLSLGFDSTVCSLPSGKMKVTVAMKVSCHQYANISSAGRAMHAWHFIQDDAPGWQRFGGFGLSMLAAVILAIGLVVHAVWTILD